MDYVGALDLGTTGVLRFSIFDHNGRPIGSAYREISLAFPRPGWIEQDPMELRDRAAIVLREALLQTGIAADELAGIGITNQRETVILWDPDTGEPVYPAIVWQDRRTAPRCTELREEEDWIVARTGLRLDPYFSATKIEWILNSYPELRRRARSGQVLFGTPDTWLIWSLSGVHVTDPTNASRTLLFDIENQRWDDELCRVFSIPPQCLPRVQPSLSVFGRLRPEIIGTDVPLAGVLGDQQAALFGQLGFEQGAAKATWGTGAFLLLNTGGHPIVSEHGLLATIAYTTAEETKYALEGSAFIAGATIQWLRDGLGLIPSAAETEELAGSVNSTGGVYLVPAFTGLGAPHWDPHARGVIVGLTRGTAREHVVRAALEGIAYETHDLVRAMEEDTGKRLTELRVDGGAAANNFLCQFQSDILGVPVVRPRDLETTARGAGFAAGLALGVWPDRSALERLPREEDRFEPRMDDSTRVRLLAGWDRAVERAKGWAE